MPGIHFVIALQGTDLLERLQHIVHVSAVQVRPSTTAAKECVTGKEGVLHPDDNTAGSMTRGRENMEC